MVDGEQGTQQKPSPQPETRPAPFPSNSNNDLHVPSSSSNLVVFGDSINDAVKKVEDSKIIQKSSLMKKHSENHDEHAAGKNPEKESPSAATSSSLASTSRISTKHSFESPRQSGYNQTDCKREAASVEGGGQSFSSNDKKRKGETQRYNIQGHTQKEEKIYKNDVLEVSQIAKELQVQYKKSIFGKSHKTESIMLRSQGSNYRKLGTYDDNPIQQEEGKNEDGDDEDRNVPAGASFFESDQMRSDQANIQDFDGDKYTSTQNIQTKDNNNKDKLSDAERQQDTRSSSPHRSDRLQSIPSPPLHHDISENRNNRNCEENDNHNTTLEEDSGSQVPIPIRENTSTDQTAEERQQKQDTSNDELCQDYTPHNQEDDYRTKARNRARNRRKNAAERNKKREEEITRLTKANFELKEKNQELINELVTLGVDAMTIQIFLNSIRSANQQSSVLVPPPKYNLSPF
ncbi:predicted protein [Chaetoceros tenuissimus]|uniref:BZIP domain-containing protein n=1 Tax=Chaetoceros tenuissimus TaxID=426638 RepID=A0AAD3DA57_9STRA|nr:predicted protein [Chaetoceros tenuissimus]